MVKKRFIGYEEIYGSGLKKIFLCRNFYKKKFFKISCAGCNTSCNTCNACYGVCYGCDGDCWNCYQCDCGSCMGACQSVDACPECSSGCQATLF